MTLRNSDDGASVQRIVHTPGPWNVYHWAEHHELAGFPSSVGQDDDLGMEAVDICTFKASDADKDEQWANAKLIAAAPELLKALQNIVKHQEIVGGNMPSVTKLIAINAISKAV